LHTLDVLLRHLQQLRASIAEDSSAPSGEISPAPRRGHVTWRDVRVAVGMLRRNLFQRGHSS